MSLLVDAHAHLHTASLDGALDAARANFETAAARLGIRPTACALLLAEAAAERRLDEASRARERGRWTLRPTAEAEAVRAEGPGASSILIVAGRQARTDEGLEVHALGTRAPLRDGRSLDETLEEARATGALVVLPWGVGKWWGRRGRRVREALDRATDLIVSDNGGRPWFWPTPELVRREGARGRPVLAGSDPLAIAGDWSRLGSYGTVLEADLEGAAPVGALLRALRESRIPTRTYGTPAGATAFVRAQVRVRRERADRRPLPAPSSGRGDGSAARRRSSTGF